jgi:hypothetical protein
MNSQAACLKWNSGNLLVNTGLKIPDFLTGHPHCLQDVNESKFEPTLTHTQLTKMFQRYDQIFSQLDDVKSKVEFTLGFINEVSKIYPVGLSKKMDDRYTLNFVQKSKVVGSVIRSMYITTKEQNTYGLTENEFKNFGSSSTTSLEIMDHISYVIHGKKKIKSNGIVTNAFNDDSEEDEEDNRNSKFREWAEEQADATCERMGCDWEWSYDSEVDEDFVLFSNEDEYGNLDFWEGYHTPHG